MALASSQKNTNQIAKPQFRAQTAPPGAAPPKTKVEHHKTAQLRTQTAPSEAVFPNTMTASTPSSNTAASSLANSQLRAQTAPPGVAPPKTKVEHHKTAQLRTQTAPSEAVFPNSIASENTATSEHAASHLAKPQFRAQTAPPGTAPPKLLRCVIVSWSEQRADLFQTAAENELWQSDICSDVGQFMRTIFRIAYPLMIVDLPNPTAPEYNALRMATERSRSVGDALLVVSVFDETQDDEIWARQLGAWAHLPGATNSAGLELIFREARQALAQQEPNYVLEQSTNKTKP